MRIAFMGTPSFAVTSLERLYADGHEIAAVFTQPDKPRNRGMKLTYSPVKETAIPRGATIYQPTTLKDADALAALSELRCDIIIVVAYGKLLPRVILEMPPYGCINIHASLLPKYRGAAPVQWAVLNGESETGVTAMCMDEALDKGDILSTKKTPIGDDETADELYNRLSILGADLLSETITAITNGEATRKPQDHAAATYAPPLKKEMSPIDWTDTAQNIKNKVRGLTPWPNATATIYGATMKILAVETRASKTANRPGEIVAAGKSGIEVACADGTVVVKEVQPPGGKRMSAAAYLRGHR